MHGGASHTAATTCHPLPPRFFQQPSRNHGRASGAASVEQLSQDHHQQQEKEPTRLRHGRSAAALPQEALAVQQALLDQGLAEAVLLGHAHVVAVVLAPHAGDEVEAVALRVRRVAALDQRVLVVPVVGGVVRLDGAVEVIAGEGHDRDVPEVVCGDTGGGGVRWAWFGV